MTKVTDWTYEHLIKQYADFLLISIHAICYLRNLYDRTYFHTVRAYSCPVHRCRHPVLVEYIDTLISAIADELRRGRVSRINIVILSPFDVALEKFVFDVSTLPRIAYEDLRVPIKGTEYMPGQLDVQFRAAIMKLMSVESRLGALPEECTFSVVIETREDANPAIQNWVDAEDIKGKKMSPLKRVTFGTIMLDSWVEETQAKVKLSEHSAQGSDERIDSSF